VEAGVYVLGALAPAERSAYERHLATCRECRNDVAELAVLPGLLGRLDAESAASIGQPVPVAPRSTLTAALTGAQTAQKRSRRRRRWERGVTLAIAACLALFIGVGAAMLNKPAAPTPVLAAMSPVVQDAQVTALIGYWPDPKGGTDIRMTCVYADASSSANHEDPVVRLDLWVIPRDGSPGRSVWYWDAGPGYRDTFWAESDLKPDQIARLEVRKGPAVLLVYKAV
jgi:anti-sigma-K factor RskA